MQRQKRGTLLECGNDLPPISFNVHVNVMTHEHSVKRLQSLYRVILKKVSFGVFSIILVFKEEKNFTMKSKDKVLSLSKVS